MANEQFFRGIDQLQVDIENEVTRLTRTLALNVLSTVTLATPVGDPTKWEQPERKPTGYVGGRARGNWQVSESEPVESETEMIDPSGAGTIQDGKEKILAIPLGNDIVIQNNVPYIVRLNEGREDGRPHSTQAPIGFIENAVAVAQETFEAERFML